MAQAAAVAPEERRARPSEAMQRLAANLGVDTRLLGMVVALILIWIGFHFASGGNFLTPRNLWYLSVQTSATAIMATGMVLVIVSRGIDLSVGSIVGFTGILMALLQAEILPPILGLENPLTWLMVLAIGIAAGVAIGSFQGFIVSYIGVPSFVVTLGGLLVWRGLSWFLASGRTIAPLDMTFRKLGGGAGGYIGETATWVVCAIACGAIIALLYNSRRQRKRFGFPLRPIWADLTLAIVGCGAVILACWVANVYYLPENLARDYAEAHGIAWPEGGLNVPFGIANPVLLALGVTIVMTFIATRRRFGRYVFAIGGNPEAAELGGINTRRAVMLTFALLGALCAISASVSIARQNAAPAALGQFSEMDVIAAAVIGGTSFAGGIGTVPGAILGALFMQSLTSGMVLLRVDTPLQQAVSGIVLVFAVAADTIVRRRAK